MTCERCGGDVDVETHDRVECRDRELANLHSLIRSVTRRLENARELLSGNDELWPRNAAAEIDAVLEALS